MAGTTQFQESQPQSWISFEIAGHGATPTTLVTAPLPNYRIDSMVVINGDPVPHVLTLLFTVGGTTYTGPAATIPANAGNGTVPAVDMITAAFPSSFSGLALPAGWTIEWQLEANLTSGTFIVQAWGGLL